MLAWSSILATLLAVSAATLPVIAVDAGHGGTQSGAYGVCGVYEKDVSLGIARDLAELLTASGKVDVRLIRAGDETLSLEERSARANAAGAALFISIHANASDNPVSRGVETYFLSRTAADRRIARLALVENDGKRTLPVTDNDALTLILDGLVLQAAHQESQRLAARVQDAVQAVMGGRGRGMLQAPFIVLRGAEMSAVLVETGFLTNRDDCALLADPVTRRAIGRALTSAVLEHLMNDSLSAARQ